MTFLLFVAGVTTGLVVGALGGFALARVHEARTRQAERTAPEPDPLHYCPFCDRAFHDDEAAREHAVKRHNAPRDGDAWRDTFDHPAER